MVEDLDELITVRNQLVHIDEVAEVLDGLNPRVTRYEDRLLVEVPVRDMPWNSVTVVKAEKFLEAVDTYFKEILSPEISQIQSGTMVTTADQHNQ
jgi:hypothetical protein